MSPSAIGRPGAARSSEGNRALAEGPDRSDATSRTLAPGALGPRGPPTLSPASLGGGSVRAPPTPRSEILGPKKGLPQAPPGVEKWPFFQALRCTAQGGWGGSAHYPDPTAQSVPARTPSDRRRQTAATGTSGGRRGRGGRGRRGAAGWALCTCGGHGAPLRGAPWTAPRATAPAARSVGPAVLTPSLHASLPTTQDPSGWQRMRAAQLPMVVGCADCYGAPHLILADGCSLRLRILRRFGPHLRASCR